MKDSVHSPTSDASHLHVVCSPGLTECVTRELGALGFAVDGSSPTGVSTRGTLMDGMRLVLELRTALHVLYRLAEMRAPDPDVLYTAINRLPWEEWIDADGYVSVISRGRHPRFDNMMFANQLVKDAIVDRIRERRGRRPDAGPLDDRTVIDVFLNEDRAAVSLNLSGKKLSDRGYRKHPHAAPVRETLAAAVLMLAEWDGAEPLLAPMCGSGTFAIEAALIAADRAPGLLRSNFGGLHLRGFDREAWQKMRSDVRRRSVRAHLPPIVASDLDDAAIVAARANAQTAGCAHQIAFHVCDFAKTPLPEGPGLVVVNPEYGRRLGDAGDLKATYRRLGDMFKQQLPGWRAAVLCGDRELAGEVGLRPRRRIPIRHAGLDARLLLFELFEGPLAAPHRQD